MHVTNAFNVEASINAAFASALNAITPPAFLQQPAIVYDWPEITASTPCFSILHMPNTLSDAYQGRGDGAGNSTVDARGQMEISAWVSRDELYNGQTIWMPRLRFMSSMIESVYTAMPVIQIRNYEASLTAPQLTGYRVVIRNLTSVQTAQDDNPAIERRRLLITYKWDLRA